ncbi:MAG: sodium-dependent transporter [Bacteroidales bacterium]|nr:sodium-dependent transporter [Bacteroidales bacterium]
MKTYYKRRNDSSTMSIFQKKRGAWGSRLGFLLAAAGSAIGLGNIWRFPYITGENGGAAFVILYLFFVFAIGLPVLIAELTIGRNTRKNPVGAFKKLFPKTLWKWVGALGVFTGIATLSFYAVVAGWALGYFIKTLLGDFNQAITGAQSETIFSQFSSNPLFVIGLFFLFILLTAVIVKEGVSAGIERWSKILMPVLFILLIVLAVYSMSLEGAGRGLEFYLKPDFSKITPTTFAMALGQAMFSLGIGIGIMITYGSYLSKNDHLVGSASIVVLFDTVIAIIAGLIIFPALFAMNMDPAGGPGLIFNVLPSIFAKMPIGTVFGGGIFLLISLAALTSTISILELPVSYFIDDRKWSRKKATWLISLIAFIMGIPSALSMGASDYLSDIPFFGMGFLDMMSIVFANYALTIGAFFISVFVGYKWGIKAAVKDIEQSGHKFRLKAVWAFLIRFICPVAIAVILGYIMITGNYLN